MSENISEKKSSADQVTIIANRLANDGKKPTVALIKSRLKTPLPLVQIITSLKTWKHDPKLIHQEEHPGEDLQNTRNTQDENIDAFKKIIDEELQPIKEELSEIKILLSKLMMKI